MVFEERQQDITPGTQERTGVALHPYQSDRHTGEEPQRRGSGSAGDGLAWLGRGLGWFSLGLGLAAAAAIAGFMAFDLRVLERRYRNPHALQTRLPRDRSRRVQKSVTVNRPPEELYRFWHDFENLPRFMDYLQSVRVTGDKRSHWKIKAPAGLTVEWDAEIIADTPNELIAWRSLKGADVSHAGSVRFSPAPGRRGTEVRVEMQYIPVGGFIGATVSKLLSENPDRQVQESLRRFKQLVEAGEIVQSNARAGGPESARPAGTRLRP